MSKITRLSNKIFIIIILSLLHGCDSSPDSCDDQKSWVVSTYGNPEEIASYISGSYESINYWYWSRGFKYGFIHNSSRGSDGFSCKVDLYEFNPLVYSRSNFYVSDDNGSVSIYEIKND